VKRTPDLVDAYADRIAAIDRRAFEEWALLAVPASVGTLAMVGVTALGLAITALAYDMAAPWNGLAVLVATAVLLVTTHGLAHLAVGVAQGMRFTHWFIGDLRRPQPGVKVDYATYLRVPATRRAWMHAAGAIATKLVPFVMLGPAIAMEAPGWTVWVLVIVGAGQIVTDLLWSVKVSDWKKFARERRYARP